MAIGDVVSFKVVFEEERHMQVDGITIKSNVQVLYGNGQLISYRSACFDDEKVGDDAEDLTPGPTIEMIYLEHVAVRKAILLADEWFDESKLWAEGYYPKYRAKVEEMLRREKRAAVLSNPKF